MCARITIGSLVPWGLRATPARSAVSRGCESSPHNDWGSGHGKQAGSHAGSRVQVHQGRGRGGRNPLASIWVLRREARVPGRSHLWLLRVCGCRNSAGGSGVVLAALTGCPDREAGQVEGGAWHLQAGSRLLSGLTPAVCPLRCVFPECQAPWGSQTCCTLGISVARERSNSKMLDPKHEFATICC